MGFAITSNSKSVGRYENGRLEHVEIGKDDTTARQEWYEDGTPSLSVLYKSNEEIVIKKLWHKNGQPEAIMHFLKGELHGALCKWDSAGHLTFARTYNRGTAGKDMRPDEIKMLEKFKELHDYTKYENDNDNDRYPTISMSLGFE